MTRRAVLWAAFLVLGSSLEAFPLPPPLETGHLLGKGLPAGTPPVPLTDEFYALGWSRSNAFAALERRTLDSGRQEPRLRIYDLVEDRVVYEEVWDDWGPGPAPESWWQTREAEVDQVFHRFGLVPTQYQLGEFPLILDNEFYTLALRATASDQDAVWRDRLEVVVRSSGRGVKAVRDEGGFWRWAAVLGFVPSPFENRLALILLVQPAGWAGPAQPLRFLVSGLSLKAGFPVP